MIACSRRQQVVYGGVLPLAVIVLLFATWETLSRAGLISQLFFPPPSTIVRHTLGKLGDGTLLVHLQPTLFRLLTGFFIGSGVGMLVGLGMGCSRRLRAVLDPLVAAVHPIPKIAVFPLIMIIFGIGETSKTVVVAVACFFPLCINSLAGVRNIHPVHFEVARNYRSGAFRLFRRVVLPGSLPMILAGTRLALNLALILTTAVELVAADKGLGAMIWLAWETLRIEDLYAAIFTVSLLGISFNVIVHGLNRFLLPWRES